METVPPSQYCLSTSQQSLLDHADKFAREQLYPLAPKMGEEEWWPGDIFPKMGALGLLGVTVAPE